MATARVALAKLLRVRVLDLASVLAQAQGSKVNAEAIQGIGAKLRVLPAAELRDSARRAALMETLASMPGGCGGEHLLIVPRAAAEEVFGPALTGPPLASDKSQGIGSGETANHGLLSSASSSGGARQGAGRSLADNREELAGLTSAEHSTKYLQEVEPASMPSLPLAQVLASLHEGQELQTLTRTPPASTTRGRVQLAPAARRLFDAVESGSLEEVENAVAACRPEDLNAPHPVHGGTCLHAAAAHPAPDAAAALVDLLCQKGAQLEARAANNSSALHWAAGSGNRKALSALLQYGADPAAASYTWRSNVFGKGSGQTPAHWAAESGHQDCVEELLNASALAAFTGDERGTLPSDLAEKEGHFEVQAVLDAAAQVDMICLAASVEASVHQVLMASGPTSSEIAAKCSGTRMNSKAAGPLRLPATT